MAGAAFCVECGLSLLPPDTLTTQEMQAENLVIITEPRAAPVAVPAAPGDNWVTLHLLESGQLLPLADRNEFTMGRSTEGQPVIPDIDLSPYQAYAHGVSRLHAVIKRGVDDIYLVDLESANGTFVNGKRLQADEEHALSNGDVVALGGLKIQVLLKPS
jgi:hypothetical protein